MTQSKDQSTRPKPIPGSESSDGASNQIADQPLENIGSKALSGGLVLVVAQGAKFVFTLAGAMILARLLAPEDFGLVAMATSLMVFLGVRNTDSTTDHVLPGRPGWTGEHGGFMEQPIRDTTVLICGLRRDRCGARDCRRGRPARTGSDMSSGGACHG